MTPELPGIAVRRPRTSRGCPSEPAGNVAVHKTLPVSSSSARILPSLAAMKISPVDVTIIPWCSAMKAPVSRAPSASATASCPNGTFHFDGSSVEVIGDNRRPRRTDDIGLIGIKAPVGVVANARRLRARRISWATKRRVVFSGSLAGDQSSGCATRGNHRPARCRLRCRRFFARCQPAASRLPRYSNSCLTAVSSRSAKRGHFSRPFRTDERNESNVRRLPIAASGGGPEPARTPFTP